MKKRLLSLFLLLIFLCACQSTPENPAPSSAPTPPSAAAATDPPPTVVVTAPAITTDPAPTEPVYVDAQALEDFLLPLEEYSTERQFDPEFVVIHFTSAVVNHRDDPYNIDLIRDIFVDYNLSIHYIIERDGTVRCYVPEDRVAKHASKGSWNDDPKYDNTMNEYAIGIELVAMGSESDMSIYMSAKEYHALDPTLMGFTEEQYASLKTLVTGICSRHAIPMDRQHIIGHDEYTAHKTDPGELFDWSRIIPE